MQCIDIEAIDFFLEESTNLLVMSILKEADGIPLCRHQTSERIVHCPPADLTGCGIASSPPVVWLNAFQEIARNRLEIHVDDFLFVQ
jgi:hypothetical protein